MFIYKKPRVKVLYKKPVQSQFLKHGTAVGRICGKRVLSTQNCKNYEMRRILIIANERSNKKREGVFLIV